MDESSSWKTAAPPPPAVAGAAAAAAAAHHLGEAVVHAEHLQQLPQHAVRVEPPCRRELQLADPDDPPS